MGDLHNRLRHHGMLATSGSWRRHWTQPTGHQPLRISTTALRLLAAWLRDAGALSHGAHRAIWLPWAIWMSWVGVLAQSVASAHAASPGQATVRG